MKLKKIFFHIKPDSSEPVFSAEFCPNKSDKKHRMGRAGASFNGKMNKMNLTKSSYCTNKKAIRDFHEKKMRLWK